MTIFKILSRAKYNIILTRITKTPEFSHPPLNLHSPASHPPLTLHSPASHPPLTRLSPVSHSPLTRLSSSTHPPLTRHSPASHPPLTHLSPASHPRSGRGSVLRRAAGQRFHGEQGQADGTCGVLVGRDHH